MNYTARVEDGPSVTDTDISTVFKFSDESVAKINPETQEISALKVGETKLICQRVRGNSKEIITQTNLEVRV